MKTTPAQEPSKNEKSSPKLHEAYPINQEAEEGIILRCRKTLLELLGENNCANLQGITIESQLHFLEFMERADHQSVQDVQEVFKRYPQDINSIINCFSICAEIPQMGRLIIDMLKYANVTENIIPILRIYAELVTSARENAEKLVKWSKQVDPSTTLDVATFLKSILHRANDGLIEAYDFARSGEGEIPYLADKLRKETTIQSAASDFFSRHLGKLEAQENVVLRDLSNEQIFVANAFESAEAKPLLLQLLQKQRSLAPVPKLFWKVDRAAQDYTERFGFDIQSFLQSFSNPEFRQLLIEFGPGNGTFRQDNQKKIGDTYLNLAICDKLYYPIAPLLRKIINFKKLEERSGLLTEEERIFLCDFLYKILVLGEGKTETDPLEYDESVTRPMDHSIENLWNGLTTKARLLASTNAVPGNILRVEEGKEYTTKIQKPDSPHLHKACDILSERWAIQDYLVPAQDFYQYLPAYPPGTLISDFSHIDRLADHQIDVALGVRSTVYKEGDDYRMFMENMTKKIAKDGLYIDDNVRENFGWNYRLSDLKKVQDRASYPLKIILGPGMKGEDYREGQSVPLAVVMTASQEKLQYIQTQLQAGYSLVNLDDLLHQTDYVKSLADGRTYSSLQELSS